MSYFRLVLIFSAIYKISLFCDPANALVDTELILVLWGGAGIGSLPSGFLVSASSG